MRDAERTDYYGQRARSGRGDKSSDRPASPPREARRVPDGRSHRYHSRPRGDDAEHAEHHRRRSRDGSRERHRHHAASESARRGSDADDLIPGYRASKARRPAAHDDRLLRRSRSRERSSPSASKRHRDYSHSPSHHHRKSSRRDHRLARRDRDRSRESDSRTSRRHSPHDAHHPSRHRHARSHRSLSPRSRDSHSRTKRPSRSPSRSRRDLISRRAASRESRESRHPRSDLAQPPQPPPAPPHSPSPTPLNFDRRRDASRPRDATTRPDAPLHPRRGSDATGPSQNADGQRGVPQEEAANHHRSATSGADDDMASRSSYRGAHNPLIPHKPLYGESRGDARAYSQSPRHSHQTSPTMSPYARGGWAENHSPNPSQYVPPWRLCLAASC